MLASVGLGAVKVAATLMAMGLVERAAAERCCSPAVPSWPCRSAASASSALLPLPPGPACLAMPKRHQTVGLLETPACPGAWLHRCCLTDQSPRPPVLSASEKTRPPSWRAEDPTALRLTPPAGLSRPEHALLHWTALVCMMVFVSAFSIGFGPGKWESSAGNLEAFCPS